MGAVAAGAIFLAVLLLVIAGFVLQGSRRGDIMGAATYLIDDAARFVHERLSSQAVTRLTVGRVRQILDWQIHWQQVIAPREGLPRPVVGSGEAMDYVLARGTEEGIPFEPLDVAEVMAAEVEYLLTIGAIGTPVEDPS